MYDSVRLVRVSARATADQGYEYLEPSLTFMTSLCNGPFVIDCSWQNESIKSGTVDVRLDFECKENVPANTTAYCLIIHDGSV